jgi:hypothetical protein
MKPETRAIKDNLQIIVKPEGGKLRITGAQDEPLIILAGQEAVPREVGGQVHVVQRDRVLDAPAPPDPHEDSGTDFEDELE